jgi:simple sugar transport system ATP-binding protein
MAADPSSEYVLELDNVSKFFGTVIALKDVTVRLRRGEVHCLLGDNGAGKSTLIKILAGVHQPSVGLYRVDAEPVVFDSPRDALDRGIATVYQDLALVPLMSVCRNFFLGREPTRTCWGIFRVFDRRLAAKVANEKLADMGIVVRDAEQAVGTMSGGERQCLAIARAIHFGARVLILDEPTAALGVKQSGVVLKYVAAARDAGLGVVFITHNPHHAYLVGDHFIILKLGRCVLDKRRSEVSLNELTAEMAGGQELAELSHELKR